MKRVLALLLAVMFLLICGCEDNKETTLSYIDETTGFDAANVLSLDNKIATNILEYDSTYYISYIDIIDGLEHISEYDESFNYLRELSGDIYELSQANFRLSSFSIFNNSIYFVYMQEKDMSNRLLIQFSLDGEEQSRVTLDTPSEVWDGRILNDVYVTSQSIILISGSGIQICDLEGHTISEISSNDKSPYYISASSITADGNLIYSCTEDYIPYLCKIDTSNGELLWKQGFSFGNQIRNICVKGDNIYILNEHQLQKINEKNKAVAVICDIRDYNKTTSAPNDVSYYSKIFCLLSDSNGFLYLYTNNKNSSDIVKMTISDKKENKEESTEKRELRIFLPYKDNLLTDLFYKFEKDTGISVSVEFYNDSFLNFNTADYLQVVSTRILSGNCGWDIMSTEVIPYIPYAGKGYFADLYSLKRGNDLKNNDIVYKNIVEACSFDDSLYYFPMSIKFLGVIDETDSGGFTDIDSLLNDTTKSGRKLRYDPDAVFSTLFRYAFSSVCSMGHNDVSFDKEGYKRLANSLKSLYCADIYSGSFNASNEYIDLFEEEYIDASKNVDRYDSFSYVSLNGYNSFRTGVGYAIMNSSGVKDEALELLLFISENYDVRYGINRKQNLSKMDQIKEVYETDAFGNKDADAPEKFRNKISEILDNLNYQIYYDTDLYSLAYKQTLAVCRGEESTAAAVERIIQAFSLYQSEVNPR